MASELTSKRRASGCLKETTRVLCSPGSEVLTLKAFANVSPGLGFGNPGLKEPFLLSRNSERVATSSNFRGRTQLLQSCVLPTVRDDSQGCKANPGLTLANAFSVIKSLASPAVSEECLPYKLAGRLQHNRSMRHALGNPTCSSKGWTQLSQVPHRSSSISSPK